MSDTNTPFVFNGTDGADTFVGVSGGENEFRAGKGNDYTAGFAEADSYFFNRGDGQDTIKDKGDVSRTSVMDRIVFGEGITLEDIRMTAEEEYPYHMTLTLLQDGEETSDSLKITYGTLARFAIEELVFHDGSKVKLADVPAYISTDFVGTAGDDTLVGVVGQENTFTGGAGEDSLTGYAEADTYVFNRGDGHDWISDQGDASRPEVADQIVFGEGIAPSDIQLAKGEDGYATNLTFKVLQNGAETGDRITVRNGLEAGYLVETLKFHDGSEINVKDLPEYSVYFFEGTEGADNLVGVYGGANQFIGGAGDDTLYGYAEADTYVFNRGDGNDRIRDTGDASRTDVKDRILFGEGIAVEDIRLEENDGEPGSDVVLAVLQNGEETGDSLTITYGNHDRFKIESLEFADGSKITMDEVAAGTESKPENARIETTFTGDSGKVGLTGLWDGSSTLDSGDLIRLEAFREGSEFSHIDGSGQTIVIIDSGVDLDHEFFGPDTDGDGVADRILYHQDFTNESDRSGDSGIAADHGSHVASIAASSDSQYGGIAAGSDIVVLQALTTGGGYFSWMEKALQWVVDNAEAYNIAAVNMSIGNHTNANELGSRYGIGDELARLEQMGVITVASAGNDYGAFQQEGASYPAIDPSTIAVGAVFDEGSSGGIYWGGGTVKTHEAGADRLTPFTQRSTEVVDIFAPGATLYGAAPGGGYVGKTGTSMAAPVVTGAVALAQQLANELMGRSLTMDEFNTAIRESAVIINDGDDENDNVANTGKDYYRLDIEAMGQYIKTMAENEPPPEIIDDGNESMDEAVTITLDSDYTGELEVSFDKDWYRIALEEGIEYTFTMKGQTLNDPYLHLHDANGTVITSNDDSNGGYDSEIVYIPEESGTYYLRSEAYWDETGTYNVNVTGRTLETSDNIAGDNSTTATLTDSESSTIDFGGDKDWFKVSLRTDHNYLFNVKASGSGVGTLEDSLVRLYNSAGEVQGVDDDSGIGADSSLVFQPSIDCDYYVEVSAYGADQQGSYTVQMISEQIVDDIPDDSSTDATLAVGDDVQGEINFASDKDWYAISLQAGKRYRFDLKGSAHGQGTLADPLLALHDASGVSLALNDDSNSSRDSQLIYTAEQSGTYYLNAGAFGSGEGTYNLSALELEPVPPVNEQAASLPIEVGKLFVGEVKVGGERWYKVPLVAGETYEFSFNSISRVAPVSLYDPSHSLVGEAQPVLDGLSDQEERIVFTAQATGYHYLKAVSTGTYFSGNFNIWVSRQPEEANIIVSWDPSLTAKNLGIGAIHSAQLENEGEQDLYAVELVEGESYRFVLDYEGSNGYDMPFLDWGDLDIYGPDGTLLIADKDGWYPREITITAEVSGTYYLNVNAEFEGSLGKEYSTGWYTLGSRALSYYPQVSESHTVEEWRLPEESSIGRSSLKLIAGDAVKWNYYALEAGSTYRFNADSLPSEYREGLNDPLLYIYDSAMNQVAFDDNSGVGRNAMLEFTPEYSDGYYVGVASNDEGDELAMGRLRTGESVDYTQVRDERSLTVSSGTLGISTSGSTYYPDEIDWFSTELEQGRSYTFEAEATDTIRHPTMSDIVLYLYDTSRNPLLQDDSAGPGDTASLVFNPEESGVYFVGVGSLGSVDWGGYDISIMI